MGSVPLNSAVPTNADFRNLQLGWPSPRLCERAGLLEGAQSVLAKDNDMSKILLYGPHKGYAPLRENIAKWLYDVYTPKAGQIHPDTICITGGASQNLANIALKFADPSYTRSIFMVEPTYFLACPIFEDAGFEGKLRGVPETLDDGIDIDFLRQQLSTIEAGRQESCEKLCEPDKPSMKTGSFYPHIYKFVIYVNPTFSNPSAKTMSLKLRQDLVALAREYDALLISDDVYDFLSWPTDPSKDNKDVAKIPPRLCDIDRSLPGQSEFGNAVSNGSFTKLIGPGIRVGWAEGTLEFIKLLANCGSSSSGGSPSHFSSTLVAHMLKTDRLQSFIRDVLVPTYRERYYAMMRAIEEFLIPLGVTIEAGTESSKLTIPDTAGGYFTYIRLPSSLPMAKAVAAVALHEYNIRIAFGHMFTVYGDESSVERAEGDGGVNFGRCMRLCWAWHEADEIREAIERFSVALRGVAERTQRGEDVGAGYNIGIR